MSHMLATPAINPHEQWWNQLALLESRTAANLLDTEATSGRWQRSVYELFSEMEEKDGHLYAVIQTRVNALLGLPRHTTPANESANARAASDLVEEAIARLPRLEEFLRALLDGLARGFAAIELLWDYDSAGRLLPADWIAHPQEYFLFDARGALRLLSPPFKSSNTSASQNDLPILPGRIAHAAATAIIPPARKFITFTFGRDARNPYGRGLCQRAYWFYWFKKNNLKFWAIYNEKFGAPTAVATYQPGTPADERERLLDVLQSLQTDAGVVVPETVSLRLLETASRGEGTTYRAMADWCNDEMSKIVLGATLTTGEGRRSGSMALGEVHNTVRQDYLESDARLLSAAVSSTLVKWIVELNLPAGTPAPHWSVDPTPPADLEQQVRIDRELVGLGVPLPVSYFHDRYGRPAPATGERTLNYDDSNLFQYHLRYGVLTINEVRARLHLPPVPWGNTPPSNIDKQFHDRGPSRSLRDEDRTRAPTGQQSEASIESEPMEE